MTIDEYAAITKRVIARDGFEDFLPTACYPRKREIRALTGLRTDGDIETAVLKWTEEHASEGEEFLVAFKSGAAEFTVIRQNGRQRESATFHISGNSA